MCLTYLGWRGTTACRSRCMSWLSLGLGWHSFLSSACTQHVCLPGCAVTYRMCRGVGRYSTMRMVSFYDIVQTLLEMINLILLAFSILMMIFSTTILKHLLCVLLRPNIVDTLRQACSPPHCPPGIWKVEMETHHLAPCWRSS